MHFNAQLKVFLDRGWIQFPQDDELSAWVASAIPYARKTIADPENAQWHRCDGTWFVGANTLANDEVGAVAASGPLTGPGCDFVRQLELGNRPQDAVRLHGLNRASNETGERHLIHPGPVGDIRDT